ncbi:flavohemoglobin expression-modulating QEGLA motif protein [Candidatus Woesearchaeota archaeon]|nr:flavohemoglobin expression-modulating QEGLA motif protein [Candidatus Woesearchaeota archaeon]
MSDFFILKKIDQELQQVINPVTFFDVNPANLYAEQDLVLKDPDYNPYFIYPRPGFDFGIVQESLNSINDHDSALGELFRMKRNLFLDKCEMLRNRGSSRFTIFARKVYGLPTKQVLEHAATLLTIESETEDKTIPSTRAAEMIRAEIKHHGFDYAVDTLSMSASAMVLVSKKKILVKDSSMFSHNYVQRLLIHEIGTHVLRAENGKEQPFMIFFHGLPDYLPTEEGLAMVNEERFGLLTNENMKNYAARAIAVKMAMSASFSKVYNYLLDYFSPATAFRIAARAKRGIADTSKPGGCPKDFVYIAGYLKLKEYLNSGGKVDDLYVGKIGVEHVNMLKDIPGLSKPRFLPKNQTFKSLLSF